MLLRCEPLRRQAYGLGWNVRPAVLACLLRGRLGRDHYAERTIRPQAAVRTPGYR